MLGNTPPANGPMLDTGFSHFRQVGCSIFWNHGKREPGTLSVFNLYSKTRIVPEELIEKSGVLASCLYVMRELIQLNQANSGGDFGGSDVISGKNEIIESPIKL